MKPAANGRYLMCKLVWWVFHPGRLFDQPFPDCAFFFFFKVEIRLRTLIPLFWQDQSIVAQRAETTVAECSPTSPRGGELRTQKLKAHLVRTQSLNVLPLKLGVGQYIAIHATLTARDFFLAYFYPSSPFTCIFSKTSPVLVVANTGFLC